MNRYFFNVYEGFTQMDATGVELPDLIAVRRAAILMTGAMLQDMAIKLWDGEEWRMEVVDEGRQPVLIVRFSLENHRQTQGR
jgi:hypothetical protein